MTSLEPGYRRAAALVSLASLLALLLQGLAVPAAMAQDRGDAAAGHQMAQRWCSNCHMVDPTQQNAAANGVPPFAAIARMTSMTALSLRVFLQTPHIRMPDFQLTNGEIDDVVAYILSLKDK